MSKKRDKKKKKAWHKWIETPQESPTSLTVDCIYDGKRYKGVIYEVEGDDTSATANEQHLDFSDHLPPADWQWISGGQQVGEQNKPLATAAKEYFQRVLPEAEKHDPYTLWGLTAMQRYTQSVFDELIARYGLAQEDLHQAIKGSNTHA